MPVSHKSRAFVIDAADYRETSKLLRLFCENEGRISLVAKGMRAAKPARTRMAEPFSFVQVTYRIKDGESLGLLTGIETDATFSVLREKLVAYALAQYWVEIVDTAAQARLASPDVFKLTRSLLETLERDREASAGALWHFGMLLAALGFAVQMDQCADCGRTDQLEHFDVSRAAAVCTRCAQARTRYLPLEARERAVELAPLFFAEAPGEKQRVGSVAARNCMTLVNEIITIHLDHRMRSFDFAIENLVS